MAELNTFAGYAKKVLETVTADIGTKLDTKVAVHVDDEILDNLTPFIGGRGVFIPIDMAPFMERAFPIPTTKMRTLMQVYTTGLDGISDRTVESGVINLGTDANQISVPLKVTGNTKQITLTFPAELAALIISKYHGFWIDGMNDAHSNNAVYFGATKPGTDDLMPFSLKNQTMRALYFTLDPSMREIQEVFLFSNMYPEGDKDSLNNYKKDDPNLGELQIPYSVHTRKGHPDLILLAEAYLALLQLDKRSISSLRTLANIATDTEAVPESGAEDGQ